GSRAAASLARMRDDLPRAAAPRTGAGQREEPLVLGHRPRSLALGAHVGRRPRLRSRAPTHRAGSRPLDAQGNGGALHRIFEGDPDLGLQVRSSGRPAGSSAPASTGEHAEQVSEVSDVAHALAEREPLRANAPASSGPPTRPRSAEPSETRGSHVPDLVVLLAFLLVAEDVVGGRDLLEAILGVLVPAVPVGVVLLGELPVGLLDLGGRGVLGVAQHLVVVLLEPLPADVSVHPSSRPAPLSAGRLS